MKMAKASEKDIDAAGDAMSVLQDISSGYYPKRDGDECEDFRFDPEDPAHLRKFYDLMSATLDASPGWPGRVIGGMCYVILFPENEILDPAADTLELHPQWVKRETAPSAEVIGWMWAGCFVPAAEASPIHRAEGRPVCYAPGVTPAAQQHIATVQADLYGGAAVQWAIKPSELPPGTKLYADGVEGKTE